MSFIESFDSFEDAQAALGAQIETAKTWIKDFQKPLLDGKQHYFLRLLGMGAEVLLIAGRTFDAEEHCRMLAERYPDECDYDDELARYRANLANGFVLTEAFSVAMPGGETGDTHAATMLPITAVDFAHLKSIGFGIEAAMLDPNLRELVRRWAQLVHTQ